MAKKIARPLVTRTVTWSLVLPLVGALIISIIPVFGWFAMAFVMAWPIKAVQFIYIIGYVPSLIASTFFFSVATKVNAWALGFSSVLIAGLSCAVWHCALMWYFGPISSETLSVTMLFSGVAAVAGAVLSLSFKYDDYFQELRTFARLKDDG